MNFFHIRLLPLGIVILLLSFTACNAQEKDNAPMNVEFTDQVTDFGTQTTGNTSYINVLFAHQAAKYKIDKNQEDFGQLVSNLAIAWQNGKAVKVTIGSGVKITSIDILKE